MNLQDAKKEFAARYYLWAKEDIKREVRERFPLLRRLETGCAFRFFSYIQTLSDEDSVKLMTASLKHQMKESAESFGEAYSPQDAELVEEYINSPVLQSPLERELFDRQIEGETMVFADRKALRCLIRAELKKLLGEKIAKDSAATWTYLTPVCDWTIQTDIDTGGRIQLKYSHNIGSPFHPFLYEHRISVPSWLGTAGQAQWSSLTPSSMQEAVTSLSVFCSHFMAVAPKLLSGIHFDN